MGSTRETLMRIQIQDSNGFTHVITSSDPYVISAWFTEHMPKMMSADTRYNHPFTLDVYPSERDEYEIYDIAKYRARQGKAAWLDLIEYMGTLADAMDE